jgi:hypothetical protein
MLSDPVSAHWLGTLGMVMVGMLLAHRAGASGGVFFILKVTK